MPSQTGPDRTMPVRKKGKPLSQRSLSPSRLTANTANHNNSRKKQKRHPNSAQTRHGTHSLDRPRRTELSLAEPLSWSLTKANSLAGAANQVFWGAPRQHMHLIRARELPLGYNYLCSWKNCITLFSTLLVNFIAGNLLTYKSSSFL